MEWHHQGSPPPKEFKTQLSAGKIMSSVSDDSEGVIRVGFLPHHVTINAQYYSNLLRDDVHQAIREKTQKEIVLLYDNACPYILWQI
jgi:hypothetical protein